MANYTAPVGNITSSVDFFRWINLAVENLFFVGIIIAFFIVIIIKLLSTGGSIPRSLTAGGFICMILSAMFRLINLVSTGFMVTFIIITVVGVVWTHAENSGRFG